MTAKATRRKTAKARSGGHRPAAPERAPETAAPADPALPPDLEQAIRTILTSASPAPAVSKPAAGTAASPAEVPSGSPSDDDRVPVALWSRARVRAALAPFAWAGGADLTAMCARWGVHMTGPGGTAAGVTALVLTASAGTWTIARLRRRRSKTTLVLPPLASAQMRKRRRAGGAWASFLSWAPVVIWVTPEGPHGLVQVALVLGSVWFGRDHLWTHRQQRIQSTPPEAILAVPEPGPEPEPEEEPEPEDPRLAAFRRRFITGSGSSSQARPKLVGAGLHSLQEVPRGFSFEIRLDPEEDVTYERVVSLRPQIAALYDVPADQVMCDPGVNRSESRARVTVLTEPEAFADPEFWDGESTYDPATGTIEIGRFGDSQPSHWRLHAPRSGMWGGMIIGLSGTGKSGDINVIACEAGMVMKCPLCGAYRAEDGTCDDCQPSRMFMLLMGDPQKQAFSLWKNKADILFWGKDACVFQTRFMCDVMDERAADAGESTWTDAKGREREGIGWFDPSPGRPGIVGIIDEWAKVTSSPFGKQAVENSEAIHREARKAGACLIWANQMPDAGQTGTDRAGRDLVKEFNVLAHRVDGTGKVMIGIKGKAEHLPEGKDMYGIGYIGGVDGRSAVPQRTKGLEEDSADRIDALDLAEHVSDLPLTIDPAVQRVMDRYGITRGMVITDEWVAVWRAEVAVRAKRKAAPTSAQDDVPVQEPAGESTPGSAAAGPISTGAVDAAAAALRDHVADHDGEPAELFDVMAATGLAAGPACRALEALTGEGRARQAGPGAWLPASGPGRSIPAGAGQ